MRTILYREPIGPLSQILADYIAFKHAQGLKFESGADHLYRFSVLSLNYEMNGMTIPQQLIDEYFRYRPNEKVGTQSLRIIIVTGFLRYAKDFGYKADFTEIPRIRKTVYMPYIFTEQEIARFFHACDTFPVCTGSRRHIIAPIFFRILYSCGLRVSEATDLLLSDVDLDNGVLIVRNPKNRRDRYVPMPESLTKAMLRFRISEHRANADGNTPFFQGRFNDCITNCNDVYRWFRLCLEKASISHRGRGLGPRVHDFRHLFCINALKSMYSQGMDIYCCLPILSAYVGHKSVYATQSYLRLTAEAYPELIEQIMRNANDTIPATWEVNDNEAD
jgi:integrase